ncbi:hypothetical protein [Rickettsia endosymbiont of Ceutorhynchus obstrictus]|uniref:hypothetical protein n=1 Tax=Rickettsia endosymbiont of Ceutorhynchus obstrictus TaxID=3066249 RepID=UPI0031333642
MKHTKRLFLFRVISSPELIFSNQTLTKERCISNAFKKIETTIYIDLNILCDIRKFIVSRNRLEINDIQNISSKSNYDSQNIKNIITLLQELPEIFLSPGFALSEAAEKYKKVNYKAFEIFLKDYLPKFRNAYDSLPYETILSQFHKEQKYEFLLTIYAGILCIHYIHKFYANLSRLDKFKLLIDTMSHNIGLVDGVVAEVAKYSFFNETLLDNNLQEMVNNFVKKSKFRDIKKAKEETMHNSWNAAHDIHFFRTCAMLEQNPYKVNPSNIECWHLTNDKGLKYLSHIIQFDKNNPGVIIAIKTGNKILNNYLDACHLYQIETTLYRELLHTKLNISDKEIIKKSLLKTKDFIQYLENKLLL